MGTAGHVFAASISPVPTAFMFGFLLRVQIWATPGNRSRLADLAFIQSGPRPVNKRPSPNSKREAFFCALPSWLRNRSMLACIGLPRQTGSLCRAWASNVLGEPTFWADKESRTDSEVRAAAGCTTQVHSKGTHVPYGYCTFFNHSQPVAGHSKGSPPQFVEG
jgi:hypothetical protein